jgi:hypothetical protein
MSQEQPERKTTVRWLVRIVVLAVVVYGVWQLFGLHVNEPPRPATPAQAQKYTGVPLPAEAHNIGVAGYRQWIQFEQYVRFEAPVDVCLKYAAKVVPGATLQPIDEYEIKRGGGPIREGVFTDFGWFDLAKGKNVVGAAGGPGTPGQMGDVWVDQDRGVFYFRKTD